MKKIFCLILVVLMLVPMMASCTKIADDDKTTITERGTLRVGMECDYAPFNWKQDTSSDRTVALADGGYADGYDVQIAKKIAEGLGVTLEIVPMIWNGLTPALQAGDIDMIIAGMSPTAERKLTIDFSDNYYQSTLVIVVKKDGAYADATKLSDFSGAKITGQINTFHYSVIDQITGVNKQTALATFSGMIVALKSGDIDGYISEKPGAVSAITSNPELSYVEFSEGNGFTASTDDTAVAVGVRKDSNITADINTVLDGITTEQREQMMIDAVANQPSSDAE